jgi:hypothetical protein
MTTPLHLRLGLSHCYLQSLSRICALGALLLCACGGAPETVVSDDPATKLPDPIPTPTTAKPTTPVTQATLLAGLYKGTLDGNPNREFLALVVPEVGKTVHVYGWYYNASDVHLAHLYEGQLELGVEGNAANVPQSWQVTEGVSSYRATVNVSSSTLSQLLADLSISRSSASSYKLRANALPQTAYDINTTPISLSSSSWNGYWSSKANTPSGALQFGADGTPDASSTTWNCLSDKAALTWQWTAKSSNFYKVTLTLDRITLCPDWQNQSLEGVATVSKQNGVDQLDMMLLDGKGAGISYRGTR